MNLIRQKISKLSIKDLQEIFQDTEQFEKDGAIGDCLLRSTAEQIINELGATHASVVIWMQMISYETVRELYLRSELA